MAHVENLWVYPIKGFDRMPVDEISINAAGTFTHDREYALLDPDENDVIEDRFDSVGKTFNGKEIDNTHEVSTAFDPAANELTVEVSEADERRRFDLDTEREAASEWFTEFIGESVDLRRREPPSFVDRPQLGPSVISTGTLEEVASWFDPITVEGARRRLRPNIEIGGVEPFWEDRILGEDAPCIEIDGIQFVGAEACARCVVPSRDPESGETIEDFERQFAEYREATLPEWADRDAFEHFFTVMVITDVPESEYGSRLAARDDISVVEPAQT